jgi:hypothetical protein
MYQLALVSILDHLGCLSEQGQVCILRHTIVIEKIAFVLLRVQPALVLGQQPLTAGAPGCTAVHRQHLLQKCCQRCASSHQFAVLVLTSVAFALVQPRQRVQRCRRTDDMPRDRSYPPRSPSDLTGAQHGWEGGPARSDSIDFTMGAVHGATHAGKVRVHNSDGMQPAGLMRDTTAAGRGLRTPSGKPGSPSRSPREAWGANPMQPLQASGHNRQAGPPYGPSLQAATLQRSPSEDGQPAGGGRRKWWWCALVLLLLLLLAGGGAGAAVFAGRGQHSWHICARASSHIHGALNTGCTAV